jgi:tyrosinase
MFLGELTPYYDGAYGQASWLPARQLDGFNATLDFVGPHGPVHVDVGTGDGVRSGTGWMQNTQTAGFDPIFWLHHSEVDRFWVGWNEAGGADPDSHTAPAWADASDDSVAGRWNFWKDGNIDNAIVIHPGDMIDPANLDPAKFPYSYEYQDLPTVPAPRQGGREAVAAEVPTLARPASPTPPAPAIANRELGTNPPEPVVVGHDPVTTTVQLQPEARSLLRTLDADNDDEPKRVILRLEGIVTKPPAGNYAVYLNRSGADHDTPADAPHLVGMFTAFGSDHDHGDDHEHHGMNASYDITDLVGYLRGRGEWEESAAQVTFVLATPRGRKVNPVAGPVTVGNVRIVSE